MKRALSMMSLIALLAGGAPTSIRAENPAPGPFAVGFVHLAFVDASRTPTQAPPEAGATAPAGPGRPLAASVWYPADPARVARGTPPAAYPDGGAPGEPEAEFFDAKDGPFPEGSDDWPDISVYRRHRVEK